MQCGLGLRQVSHIPMLVVFRLFVRTPGTFFRVSDLQCVRLSRSGSGPRNEYEEGKMWCLCDGPRFWVRPIACSGEVLIG